MQRFGLRDDQWERIKNFLPCREGHVGGNAADNSARRHYNPRIQRPSLRTHLLRRSYREGGTVKNETLGNLSHLPESLIEIIRRSLQGETFAFGTGL